MLTDECCTNHSYKSTFERGDWFWFHIALGHIQPHRWIFLVYLKMYAVSDQHLLGCSQVTDGHLVVLEPHKSIAMAALLPAASVASSQALQQQLHQQQFTRSQSSSAPPALASDADVEIKGGDIKDRRSTRSLEALFKVLLVEMCFLFNL